MDIKQFTFNHFGVNTYVVSDKISKEAIVIDCACFNEAENQQLASYLTSQGLTLVGLYNTHLHVDHIMGASFIYRTYGFKPAANIADKVVYDAAPQHGAMFGMELKEPLPPLGQLLTEEDQFKVGQHHFNILHVPGHSPGSLCFYAPKQGVVFVGDVLFNGSIGRTDLTGGNHTQLISGIQNKLLVLPENTVVYPGHGPKTTIGLEKMSNPFLQA